MVRNTSVLAVVFAMGFIGAGTAQAAWPNLNPFSTQKSSSNSWWPGGRSTSNQPSTMTKISNSTKSMMKKTGDMLNPTKWGTTTPTETPQQTLRKSLTAGRTASKPAKSESSWWSPWPQEPETDKPRTVSEFLKSPRPGFND